MGMAIHRAIVGSFLGKTLAALFIAVCVSLGFGPDKWATALMGIPESDWVFLARTVVVVLGGLVLLIVFVNPFLGNSSWIFVWRYRPEDDDWVPFRRTIPLSEASQRAYEQLRGYKYDKQKLPAMMADMSINGDSRPISWFGHAIVGRGAIPVFGRHPPSTKLELVPKNLIKAGGHLSDDADSIRYYMKETPEFVDLSVKRIDFRRRLKVIEGWDVKNT